MEDIIIIDSEQTEYDQIDINDPIYEKEDDIEYFIKIEEESINNESKQIDKSNIFISDSYLINNYSSVKSVNINDYPDLNMTLLWSNSNIDANFNPQTLSLDLSEYTLIGITFRETGDTLFVFPVGFTSDSVYLAGASGSFSNLDRVRIINTIDSSGISFGSGRQNGVVYNDCMTPREIFGISLNSVVNPSPTPVPNVSGNNINNYYIYVTGVSDNSLSYNIMNKRLNNYSVSESILLFIFMGLFVAGFSWFIKKNIFKL